MSSKNKSSQSKTLEASPKAATSWVQAMLWLMMALLVGVITFMVWIASEAPAMQPQVMVEKEQEATPNAINFSRINHIDELTELRDEVNPINFDTLVRDLRQYPEEFKDSRYFKEHEGEWTVQVMDVGEHKVIVDYLDGREDRDKFAYFRYRDENDDARFILTYDVMPTPQMAMGAARTIDFNLPDNVRVLPEEIARYLSIIENYEISEPVEDISVNRSRKVRLQPTNEELPPSGLEEDEQDDDSDSSDEQSSARSIEASTDTDETLAVNVERTTILTDSTNSNSNSNNSNNSNTTNNTGNSRAGSDNSSTDNSSSVDTDSTLDNNNSNAPARSSNAGASSGNSATGNGNRSQSNPPANGPTLEAEVINPPRNIPIINDENATSDNN